MAFRTVCSKHDQKIIIMPTTNNTRHFQNTIIDHAADFIENGADSIADLANGIFGALGEEQLETRGKRNKNKKNKKQKQPEEDPVRVTFHYIFIL